MSATLTQSLIDIREEPFVLIDADYRIVAANAAYCSAYGAEEKEIIGRRCHEVSHHRASPCHLHKEDCPHQQVFKTGQTHEVFHTHYDHQGHAEQVRILGYAIADAEGRLLLGESIRRAPDQPDLNCHEIRLIGRSPALLRAVDNLRQAARSTIGVLLLGESGVGKELAAHFVHEESARADRAFLAIDCASLSESLFESEFFGHERGSFTGCIGRKKGLFETADGGTLFLDEIGELPLSMQAKLLRVLETGEFRRLGGRATIRADVRVVAATNRDLPAMVARGTFREDLYYRLACITIRLPSLRDRRSDVPALAEALIARINRATGKNMCLTGDALEWLMRYDFPGNVRELRNMLERAAALAPGDTIDTGLLDTAPARLNASPPSRTALSMNAVEADYIRRLLREHDGNRRKVAQILDMSERTVYRKIRRYNIEG